MTEPKVRVCCAVDDGDGCKRKVEGVSKFVKENSRYVRLHLHHVVRFSLWLITVMKTTSLSKVVDIGRMSAWLGKSLLYKQPSGASGHLDGESQMVEVCDHSSSLKLWIRIPERQSGL